MPTTNCYPEGNRKNFIMVQIDVEKNEIVELPPKRFGELNFTERGHLQEWISKFPECLGGWKGGRVKLSPELLPFLHRIV